MFRFGGGSGILLGMLPEELKPNHWYWIRREDGSLAPYRFHQISSRPKPGKLTGEFFVGSMIQTMPLNQVVAEAQMPETNNKTTDH